MHLRATPGAGPVSPSPEGGSGQEAIGQGCRGRPTVHDAGVGLPSTTPRRRYDRGVDPVLHLSIVVAELDRTRSFYVDLLGCRPGRSRHGWMDVWFHGLQLTLQHRPDDVMSVEGQGARHFGVTLERSGFDEITARLRSDPGVRWVVPVTTDFAGSARQQVKCKIADPSGNIIELKTYLDPEAAFADH